MDKDVKRVFNPQPMVLFCFACKLNSYLIRKKAVSFRENGMLM